MSLAIAAAGGGVPVFAQQQHGNHVVGKPGPCAEATLDCANAATPFFTRNGRLWLAWSAGGAVSVASSGDMGRSFGPRIEIARHEGVLDTGSDARPQIVETRDGRLVVAYAFFRDRQWNAQVNVSTSSDAGMTFSVPRSLSRESGSQRFATLGVDPEGRLFAFWIDKRLVAAATKAGRKRPGGAIAVAWSDDDGRSFKEERIVHEDSCECCRIAVALTPAGMPGFMYRAIFDGRVRDHVVQVMDSMERALPARRVADDNWVTDSCPHHGPALSIAHTGTLHAAWFTQGTHRTGSYYARSVDGGLSFSEPLPVGNAENMPGRTSLLAEGGTVWMAWKEFDGRRATVWARRSGDDGHTWSPATELAMTTGYSDHPLLISREGRAWVSWFTRNDGYRLLAAGDRK